MRDAVAEGEEPVAEFLHVVVLVLSCGDLRASMVAHHNTHRPRKPAS
jgi:hypothetical protein